MKEPNMTNVKFMPIYPVTLMVSEGLLYYSEAFKNKQEYNLWNTDGFDFSTVLLLLDKLIEASNKQLCLGVQVDSVSHCQFATKFEKFTWPYEHYRSRNCTLLFNNHKHSDICSRCINDCQNMVRNLKRKMSLPPLQKVKRMRIDSECPYNFLTPRSKKICLQRVAARHRFKMSKVVQMLIRKIQNILCLNDEQSQEMNQIVQIIQKDFSAELNHVITTDTNAAQQEALKQIWDKDVQDKYKSGVESFQIDQTKNITGARSNKWSVVTYRIALAVYCRSPSTYRALQQFNILKLPSCSSMKNKCKNYNEKPGINYTYLWEQRKKYDVIKKEATEKGQKKTIR